MVTKSAGQIALENKIYNLYPIYRKNPIKSRYTELVWLIYELISKYEYKYLKTMIYEGEIQKKHQVMMDTILDKIEDFLKSKSDVLLSLPQDQFFKYLYSPISQAEALFYRKNTHGLIKLPHNMNELLYQINQIIEYEQSMSKEPLSEEKIVVLITEVYCKCTKEEYYQLKNAISIVNIDTPINDKDGETLNITDLEIYRQYQEAKTVEKAAEAEEEAAKLEKEAISYVLNNETNNKDCKKGLCTWHYLTSMKDSYKLLLPVLDRNLVNDYENRRINDQYEVYMRFNPGCTQKEATNNSAKIKERLNKKIEAYKQNKQKNGKQAVKSGKS